MTGRYIKTKDGKLAGSLPDPNALRAPQPSTIPTHPTTTPNSTTPNTPSLEDIYTEYQQAAQPTPDTAPAPAVNVTQFNLNTDYPYPKVNNLSKMLQALEAVDGGACTDDAIAEAIGSISDREGSYHATNLGYLGFATATTPPNGGPREWTLTPQGVHMLEGTPETRITIMEHLINQFPDVTDVRQADGTDYADATINRRASSVPAWEREIENATTGGTAFHTAATQAVQQRMDRARQIVTEQRARHAAPPPPPTCTTCYMVLPATGHCDNCD